MTCMAALTCHNGTLKSYFIPVSSAPLLRDKFQLRLRYVLYCKILPISSKSHNMHNCLSNYGCYLRKSPKVQHLVKNLTKILHAPTISKIYSYSLHYQQRGYDCCQGVISGLSGQSWFWHLLQMRWFDQNDITRPEFMHSLKVY